MRLNPNEQKFHDEEMYKIVSKNIKFYREHHRNSKYIDTKLTQMKMSEEAEISRSLLSGIESQKFYIEFSLSVVNRCAVVCNIPLYYYFLKEPPKEFFENKES